MTLSVALCTFNGAEYLGEQLESLAAQTHPPDEVVVCDDGSTDGTQHLVGAFASRARFPVRLHVNQRRVGTTKNFEQAVALCTGTLIALADQDDVWLPMKLERIHAAMASPRIGLVFSDADLVDERLRPLNRRLWQVFGSPQALRMLQTPAHAVRLLLPGWTVTGATMAFRAELRPLLLPIPTELALIHDGWIALVVSAVSRIRFIDEPLMLYRQHAAQQIGARPKPTRTSSLRLALHRPTDHAGPLRTLAALRDRLRSVDGQPAPSILHELDTLTAHLELRRRLPPTWIHRLPLVARELLARRYHRYGAGIRSAAKDLVMGSIAPPS